MRTVASWNFVILDEHGPRAVARLHLAAAGGLAGSLTASVAVVNTAAPTTACTASTLTNRLGWRGTEATTQTGDDASSDVE